MDTRNGNMFTGKEYEELKVTDPKTAKWLKAIPDIFLPELSRMNRTQRRDWYRKNKKRIQEVTK